MMSLSRVISAIVVISCLINVQSAAGLKLEAGVSLGAGIGVGGAVIEGEGSAVVKIPPVFLPPKSGLPYCGNKFCGLGADCDRKGKSEKCLCPIQQAMGDPSFRCHSTEKVSCLLIGDPILLGFTGSLTFMDFPCKYTLSKFDTPLNSRKHNNDPPGDWFTSDPGRDRCRIIVHGNNAVTPLGSYYLKSVNIIVTFNIAGSQSLKTMSVTLEESQASYMFAPDAETFIHKDDEQDCIAKTLNYESSIGLSLCYTNETKMWSFGVAVCSSTSINFRPWVGIDENQPYRPGVSIITDKKTSLFHKDQVAYPSTMCDSPNNVATTDDVYHENCKSKGIDGKRNCALHAWLDNPPQQPEYCEASVTLFKVCPDNKKVKAINRCGPIVTKHAKCVMKNNGDVLNAFEACVNAICFKASDCKTIAKKVHHPDDDECNEFQHPC